MVEGGGVGRKIDSGEGREGDRGAGGMGGTDPPDMDGEREGGGGGGGGIKGVEGWMGGGAEEGRYAPECVSGQYPVTLSLRLSFSSKHIETAAVRHSTRAPGGRQTH